MSELTKVYHRKNYPAIDAAAPEQSQAGRKVLVTGASSVLGRGVAEGFVTAGADTVVITSRNAERAATVAKEIQSAGGDKTKVIGYEYDLKDRDSVKGLWDNLERDGIQVDVLILNATDLIPPRDSLPSLASGVSPFFESAVMNQAINVDRFLAQGSKEGKVLIYVATNAMHSQGLPLQYTVTSSTRLAFSRMMADLGSNTPVEQVKVHIVHPCLVPTPENSAYGFKEGSLGVPFDDISLPTNFFVWLATKKANFLQGRFVWSNWDVNELIAMKDKFEADPGFLKPGIQGLPSQTFPMQLARMATAV